MTDALDIWLYGTRIARIETTPGGRIQLDWTVDARDRWGEVTRVLSAKLPIGLKPVPALVRNYLDGLLPEGNARTNHAMNAGISPDDTFGLIRAYGRDTPGAAVFVDPDSGDPTRAGRYEPISFEEVSERLRSADAHSPTRYDGLTGESSTLPGMVPKIVLHREGSNWFACKDGAPSTWILKRAFPSDSGIGDIIDTEVACLALARDIGLTTVQAEVVDFGDHRAIAVSRYDRRPVAAEPRLHQEDLAQAIGLSTSDPNRKFQYGSQMPSLAHAAAVLRVDGGNPDRLLRLATFSHLVGNTDMHAKNISFLRMEDGRVALAPAYDIAMHLHHPRDNRRSALDVNGKFLMPDISIDDFVREGMSWELPQSRAARVVYDTVLDMSRALGLIVRSHFPGVSDEAWDRVAQRVEQARLSVETGSLITARQTRGGHMATSVQIRQKLAELAGKRANLEKKIGEAQKEKSAKESQAANKLASANRTSSDGLRKSYLRQAESAQKAALSEGARIADLSKRLADIAQDEGNRNKDLTAALKKEAAADARAANKARRDRESEERRLADQRRADDRRRQQERLADEHRQREEQTRYEQGRLEDQEAAASLIGQTEQRLAEQIEAIRAPRKEQLRILYATATSHGDLRVDEEIRRVKAAVKASTHRDQVLIEHLPAATAGDLLDGLTSFRPHVVHFSGHANESVLVFDDGSDEHGDGRPITAKAFKSALEAPDEAPTLVVLNACKSAAQLESLLGRVPMAIGMKDSIGDVDAMTFATRFYRTLAEGQSVSAALATARADMEMNGLPDHDLPTLVALEGLDPTTIRLVIAPD